MHLTLSRPLAIILTLAGLLAAPSAQAGPGGDEGHAHGNEPAQAAGSTQPRFAATSELFELVGVLNGRQLTVWLDHSADNAPVKDARIELEIGGQKVALTARADGEFEAALAQALPVGVSSVTATITTPKDSDLLAGEIDLHEAPHSDDKPHAHSRLELAAWALGGLAAAGLLAWTGRRLITRRQASAGSAA